MFTQINPHIASQSRIFERFWKILLSLFILVTVIVTFVPFIPIMPEEGLDPSWRFGMNEASRIGLAFGREVVFTFGPYAAIYTKVYHPSTDQMMLYGSLYLALSLGFCLIFLLKYVAWQRIFIFNLMLGLLMYIRDSFLLCIPMVISMVCFKVFFSEKELPTKNLYPSFLLALLFSPLGLLPLVKGSILILCAAVSVLCCAAFVLRKAYQLAVVVVLGPILSMLFFWLISGQHIFDLPVYLINMIPIVSGYTEAMASSGNIAEIILFLFAATGLVWLIVSEKERKPDEKIFLVLVFSLFLFISFKAGFIRHDGHSVISGTSLLISYALLALVQHRPRSLPVLALVILSWAYIDSSYFKTSTEGMKRTIDAATSSAWQGIRHRIKDKGWLQSDYDDALTLLRAKANFPVLKGTTDIYSFNQSYLIASGNNWSTRPVLQSYSAYTPALIEMNRQHLLGSQAPDNIIFSIEPIDNRFPSIEDGASWPILMTKYHPTKIQGDFLFLKKNDLPISASQLTQISSGQFKLGQNITVPETDQTIFAEIEIEPSLLGSLANLLFKASQLQLFVELKNGEKKEFRIVSGMTKTGFVLSPLVENIDEYVKLYDFNSLLDAKQVKSFRIEPKFAAVLWKNELTIRFSSARRAAFADTTKLERMDVFQRPEVNTAEICQGSIDEVNGVAPAPENFSASKKLTVNGWIALSVEKGILAEDVYIVLTDMKGIPLYIRAQVNPRPDLGNYFRNPKLSDAGYIIDADIAKLNGRYDLGLAIKQDGKMKMCRQFRIPVKIMNG
ncbi:hypothetical protein AAKU64_002722 [Undibacterium sp. GrIS 1.8]|uniref:hypothetical protein n=1 Tax=unclassified Undibacterium TaxID=2630295 RepID=UPI00339A5117